MANKAVAGFQTACPLNCPTLLIPCPLQSALCDCPVGHSIFETVHLSAAKIVPTPCSS